MANTKKSQPEQSPYVTALLTIAVIGLVIWAIAGYMMLLETQNGNEPGASATWSMLGGVVGYPALLIYLLAGALRSK